MMIFVFTLVGLMLIASAANAEEIHNFRMCRKTRCEVYSVYIDPCPEALDNQPCEIPQGINASIIFKYRPKFGSMTPQTRLYAETLLMDLPFMDMDTNACLYTECPIRMNAEQDWKYNLFISPDYPKNSYTVKLKFWDNGPKADKHDECCFKFNMKIV
ncbi:MD-2-related lipid-recognition protein-like [Melanaphis sacchari]|uniref:MD-2-related lipid-recognition protein-like n=1 Tax=Melanaphis sacchari TaxID=742174 RepID=UPI000DC13866|nr:MD-2-related lipid-recognition protein-like [Melanaphis sacchari]